MEKVTSELLNNATIVVEELQKRGIICGIAGGFPRDITLGATPKDCDIVVAGGNDDENGVSVQNACITVEDVLHRLFGNDWRFYCVYSEAGGLGDRMVGVWKVRGLNIDIILYHSCASLLDVVDSFDFNLNQFIMDGDKPKYVGETSLATLVPVRQDASPERIVKVAKKHRDHLAIISLLIAEGELP